MLTNSSKHYDDTKLDVYDEPVREYLESYISRLKQSPSELEPIIYAAIIEAKKIVGASVRTNSPAILMSNLRKHASTYIIGVLSQSNKWRHSRERIRAYSSIFLTGAGVSFGSYMPLASILIDLLKFCKANDWEELRTDNTKCLDFKKQFKTICDRKQPSSSHNLIIYNFPTHILEIICLNWDDLFERAAASSGKFVNKINEDIGYLNTRHLWKFHGDICTIKKDNIKGHGGWIFPDEEGHVFDTFTKYIEDTHLKDEQFTFIIVGYSEKEQIIYDKIVKLLEKSQQRPTYRIGLDLKNLHDSNYIVGTSDYILDKILPIRTPPRK